MLALIEAPEIVLKNGVTFVLLILDGGDEVVVDVRLPLKNWWW